MCKIDTYFLKKKLVNVKEKCLTKSEFVLKNLLIGLIIKFFKNEQRNQLKNHTYQSIKNKMLNILNIALSF